MHGRGTLTFADGSSCVGEWKGGKLVGFLKYLEASEPEKGLEPQVNHTTAELVIFDFLRGKNREELTTVESQMLGRIAEKELLSRKIGAGGIRYVDQVKNTEFRGPSKLRRIIVLWLILLAYMVGLFLVARLVGLMF